MLLCRAAARGGRRDATASGPGGGALMRTAVRHWVLAVSLALLLHAGLAVVPLWQMPVSGQQHSGAATIEVIFGPPGSVPEGLDAEDAALPAAERAAAAGESSLLPEPDAGTPAEALLPEASDEAAETMDSVPADTVAEIEPGELAKAASLQAPTKVDPVALAVADRSFVGIPRPARKPMLPQPVQREQVEREGRQVAPTQRAQASVPAAVKSTAPPGEQATMLTAASAVAASEGKSGMQPTSDTDSAGGTPGATSSYAAQLQAWLEKHKEYPRRAELRRQQGTALLYLILDRDGQVLEHRIKETSGHRLLDREVLAMIERAQPLPRMPDEVPNASLELVVPVEFFLR